MTSVDSLHTKYGHQSGNERVSIQIIASDSLRTIFVEVLSRTSIYFRPIQKEVEQYSSSSVSSNVLS